MGRVVTAVSIVFSASLMANPFEKADLYPDYYVKDSYIVQLEEPRSESERIVFPPNPELRGTTKFGEHSNGQTREEVAQLLGIRGEVVSIYDAINALHLNISREEAIRLADDPRVKHIEQDIYAHAGATQTNPGWALDRLDESSPINMDNTYSYTYDGSGQKIYIIDTGLNLGNPTVAAEFGSRASIVYDMDTGGTGYGCDNHGTNVANLAGGSTYGVAKGVQIFSAKVFPGDATTGCTGGSPTSESVMAFNWLAVNETPGTIANWSLWYRDPNPPNCTPIYSSSLTSAIEAAHDAGILVVVIAGNDNCSSDDYSPAEIPESFVVGAVLPPDSSSLDRHYPYTRLGTNISTLSYCQIWCMPIRQRS